MSDTTACFIDVAQLRIGLFVYLDTGWMGHPFALNSFKITSHDQIDVIRGLGLKRLRYSPEKSDPPQADAASLTGGDAAETATSAAHTAGDGATDDGATAVPSPTAALPGVTLAREERRELLASQRASLQLCERQFSAASRAYRQLLDAARQQPAQAHEQAHALVDGLIGQMLDQRESSIRLLSEKVGERTSLHAVNVAVIALLCGKASDLPAEQLTTVGLGALLHDIGKIELPDRLRWRDDGFTAAEEQLYREHVGHGVRLAARMGLARDVQLVITQHHEHADGSGFPLKLRGEQIHPAARIVALVNHYDNLCNPTNPALALTPHEALSVIFAKHRAHVDARLLGLFIRMMGVYPPGSVVELNDGRYALVVSVNSSRPLKPRIVIHDTHVPPEEALVVDMEQTPELGIRRSLKPLQLPRAAFDYLSPRQRMCYFFERAREAGEDDGPL